MHADTAGQEEYRSLWASSATVSDAYLLVYDITSAASLQALDYFNDLIDMSTETAEIPVVKIVAGNKSDLASSREVSSSDGLKWARDKESGFMETSAKDMVNIEETFQREFTQRESQGEDRG